MLDPVVLDAQLVAHLRLQLHIQLGLRLIADEDVPKHRRIMMNRLVDLIQILNFLRDVGPNLLGQFPPIN